MIKIVLQGGLGNQMFEYATAKALAMRLDTEVVLDLSFFSLHGKKAWNRPYELYIFDHKARMKNRLLDRCWTYFLPKIRSKVLRTNNCRWGNFYFDNCTYSDLLKIGDNAKLFGYFVNVNLFSTYRDAILMDFTFKNHLNESNQDVANKIIASNSISVHIRRGDYLATNNVTVFASQDIDWYKTAITDISTKISDPTFFFFSDDIEWAKDNFGYLENACFVDINNSSELAHNDMRLMSLCKHNIIANSTFSWWGAWLNINPDKIVLAPKQYYRDNDANDKIISNLMPKDWTLI